MHRCISKREISKTFALFSNSIKQGLQGGKTKETNIRLTYVHTYQSTVGSISFQGGSSGVAAGVSLSSCDKQWQIEVDVPGIYY